jgi:hypothetical protein
LERIYWGLVGVGTKASRREAYEGLDGFAKPSRGGFSPQLPNFADGKEQREERGY